MFSFKNIPKVKIEFLKYPSDYANILNIIDKILECFTRNEVRIVGIILIS